MMLIGCGGENRQAAPSETTAPGRVVVLGDSLAVSPTRAESFPAVLQQRLTAEGLPWEIVNAGVSGDTTGGGLARLDNLLASNPQLVILALGANDGLRGVEPSQIRRNLDEIIRRAKSAGVDVLLCGMETPPLRGWNYTLAFHNIFPELARDHDLPFVPFLLTGVFGNRDLNQDDLIHPNAAGALRIAETVWPYLEPLVRRLAAA